jgi:hypothetical protein
MMQNYGYYLIKCHSDIAQQFSPIQSAWDTDCLILHMTTNNRSTIQVGYESLAFGSLQDDVQKQANSAPTHHSRSADTLTGR